MTFVRVPDEKWPEEDSPDADLDNADWIKSPSDFAMIPTAEAFKRFIEGSGMTLEQFKQLPIYRNGSRKPNRPPWWDEL